MFSLRMPKINCSRVYNLLTIKCGSSPSLLFCLTRIASVTSKTRSNRLHMRSTNHRLDKSSKKVDTFDLIFIFQQQIILIYPAYIHFIGWLMITSIRMCTTRYKWTKNIYASSQPERKGQKIHHTMRAVLQIRLQAANKMIHSSLAQMTN